MLYTVKAILHLGRIGVQESFCLRAQGQFPNADLEKTELLTRGKKRKKAARNGKSYLLIPLIESADLWLILWGKIRRFRIWKNIKGFFDWLQRKTGFCPRTCKKISPKPKKERGKIRPFFKGGFS